jgi:hypothetical protein
MKRILKKILPRYIYIYLRNLKNKKIINFYPYHLLRYLNIIKIDYAISSKLTFGNKENKFFNRELTKSKFYLEFGSGNSTILANNKKIFFLSVESDKNFYDYMIKKISKKKFYFVNFGVTGFYSVPYFARLSKNNAINYSSTIFENFSRKKKIPDLVLVDGRYRVLVGLFAYKFYFKNKKKFKIIFDDFFKVNNNKINRMHYKILKKFFKIKKIGRFGVSSEIKNENYHLLEKNLITYAYDPR